MNFGYNFEYYDYMEPDMGAAGGAAVALGIWAGIMLVMMAYSITVYVLQSLGLYTIAKRRGIHKPWLSWIPVGNVWILGSVSDQYQYVVKGKVRSRRKLLLGMSIALIAVMLLFYIWLFASVFGLMVSGQMETLSEAQALKLVLSMLAFVLALAVMAIVTTVFQYIAYFDLFDSCDPNCSVLFLALSIVFSFLLPFFVFASRRKDLGMPPKKPVASAPVAYQTVVPVQPEAPAERTEE